MKTKPTPTVSQTIRVTIEGKTFEMSKDEATKLHDGLRVALNLPAPIQWQPPIVIERDPHVPPYKPHWPPAHWWDTHTVCDSTVQEVQSWNSGRFNLTGGQ